MRIFLVFVLAICSGGALALATYNYVQNLPAAQTVSLPTRPVVVAARDLAIGAELKSDDVRVVEWPASAVPQDAIEKPEDVIGRGVVLPFIQYEPILPLKLAAEGVGAGLPPAIPPGLRAVSVRVDEVIGVAGYVVPGTHVDVVATVSPGGQQQDITSKVVLTDVQVVAAGTKIDNTEADKPMPVSVVTLLVNPEEAERLTLAAGEGKIQLALRNPLDRERPVTSGVRPAGLLNSAPPVRQVAPRRAQAAAQAAPPAPTVEIIRGDKREQTVVRPQEQ
jgi:pilus assembly protein CpaB